MVKINNSNFARYLLYGAVILLPVAFIYISANYRLMVEAIFYRLHANDLRSAVSHAVSLALQFIFLAFLAVVSRGWVRWLVAAIFFTSLSTNIVYRSILGVGLDVSGVRWLLSEVKSFNTAFFQFQDEFSWGLLLAFVFVSLLFGLGPVLLCRMISRSLVLKLEGVAGTFLPLVILVVWIFIPLPVKSGEVNLYGLAFRVIFNPMAPHASIPVAHVGPGFSKNIVLIVDESISWKHFDRLVLPAWRATHRMIDYGEAFSTANCSTQSNVALRWGLHVKSLGPGYDLKSNPTIWQYARNGGYRTHLFDGQTKNIPQNMFSAEEIGYVEEFHAMSDGVDTDINVAKKINQTLRNGERNLIFAVLRGLHYQYQDHYPNGNRDAHIKPLAAYEKALMYSKPEFVANLLDGVSEYAVIYTSDHGQLFEPGAPPHCSSSPGPEEYSVPLLFFSDLNVLDSYRPLRNHRTYHSQIFPTLLSLMGYPDSIVHAYDAPLGLPSNRPVRLGKSVVLEGEGDTIDFSEHYP